MRNEISNNSELMLDCSQRTQVQSEENAYKLYKVKEVCNLTGLSRKQLFDYQDIVKPTSYDKSGYKLYDSTALQDLVTIAELRGIDTSLKQIRKLIKGQSTKENIVKEQIKNLEKQRNTIEKMILKAKGMISID